MHRLKQKRVWKCVGNGARLWGRGRAAGRMWGGLGLTWGQSWQHGEALGTFPGCGWDPALLAGLVQQQRAQL